MPKPMLLYPKNHDFKAFQKGKKWVIFININVTVCISIHYKAKNTRVFRRKDQLDNFYRKHSVLPSAFLTHKNWSKLRMLLKSRWGVKIGWVKQADNGIKQEI